MLRSLVASSPVSEAPRDGANVAGGRFCCCGLHAGYTAKSLTPVRVWHQILAAVLQIVSGPGGVASFLRRNLLGKGLNGPSLPLDVGQP